ncbi:vacuolar protein sorting-associated protein-like protein vps5 [Microthyrium microscopicum]|uniref:Vacuolar protein sorting-associated protein-like protein vps5 n=1 Tax=Microthyrium microscopicum TaxID=703497 RepID=A0A6A6UIG7_9PEZI|nr:vacuolar protein sorting-associated protein-like protein vps5 [Microthyrium microscopicum]
MDFDHDSASPWDDVPSQGAETVPESSNNNTQSAPTSSTAAPRNVGTASRGRGPRNHKRMVVHTTKVESADDALGPLGPLGDSNFPTTSSTETESVTSPPPQGQTLQPQAPRPNTSSNASLRTLMGSVNLEDHDEESGPSGARSPPPVQPSAAGGPPRQPSVNVVEASKPTFHITVGDPHKVGDITSAHTEYQVYTKTTSKAYRTGEFTVSRRFRDFLWLYNQMHTNNPGIIVPPPPEKQAVGRFNQDFVESRRQALERMLNKTAAHPILQRDSDLKLFLESESFAIDIRQKERKEPLVSESKGMFSGLGIGSSGTKYVEHDDWFHERRIYLDALENQLKALEKAVDTVVQQRRTLADACSDFSISLHSLASVELSPAMSGPLEGLSEVQMRIRDLYDRQAQQDILTLGIVIDEYIRMIGSCKQAFSMREKSYTAYQEAENTLNKKKGTQDKLLRQGKSQQDRLVQLEAEVADAEKRAHQARLLWDDLGRILRQEVNRFEMEKVEEFKSSVETYLEGAVEAQKELIEIWETYLMRLDAEEEVDHDEDTPLGKSMPAAPAVQPPHEEADNGLEDSTEGEPAFAGAHHEDE